MAKRIPSPTTEGKLPGNIARSTAKSGRQKRIEDYSIGEEGSSVVTLDDGRRVLGKAYSVSTKDARNRPARTTIEKIIKKFDDALKDYSSGKEANVKSEPDDRPETFRYRSSPYSYRDFDNFVVIRYPIRTSALSKHSAKETASSTAEATSTRKEETLVVAPEASLSGQQLMDNQRLDIADVVQSYDLTQTKGWEDVTGRFSNASLFAIESAPTSYSVDENGIFKGRARVLINVDRELRSGRTTTGSVAIPARIQGQIGKKGEVTVSEFILGLEPTG